MSLLFKNEIILHYFPDIKKCVGYSRLINRDYHDGRLSLHHNLFRMTSTASYLFTFLTDSQHRASSFQNAKSQIFKSLWNTNIQKMEARNCQTGSELNNCSWIFQLKMHVFLFSLLKDVLFPFSTPFLLLSFLFSFAATISSQGNQLVKNLFHEKCIKYSSQQHLTQLYSATFLSSNDKFYTFVLKRS